MIGKAQALKVLRIVEKGLTTARGAVPTRVQMLASLKATLMAP